MKRDRFTNQGALMNSRLVTCLAGMSAAVVLLQWIPVWAQAQSAYPTKPIRIVIPFAPGGASDFVGRIIQPPLSEQLGQQVIMDNRAGAAGNIGVDVVAHATPDGYTLLLGNVGTMAINAGLYPSFPILPWRDLVAISELVDVPSVLVANLTFKPNTVKEFIAYAKANPGKLNFGSPGPGSANRLEMEAFARNVGLSMVHIGYKGGAGPAVIGLMGNETQIMFVTLSSAVNFVKQSRLKALSVTAQKRLAVLPDVPTMPELGYAAMKSGSWQGLFAPKGTPAPVIQRLFATSIKVMDMADVKKRLGDGGVDIIVSKSPADFLEFVKSETNRFGTVIKDANIVAD
jgi:tripartite-type tricarboxylate transporter receptor subunit TctC